jgi:predicted metal-dependent phosphoesterase TrpH
MIDLHLHTNASDGCSSPEWLVRQVQTAGIDTFAVTDHDTVAALAVASASARAAGLRFVPGIEVTTVHEGRDVHVLGYFVDPDSAPLLGFLAASRADRVRRARAIAERLHALGAPIDVEAIIAAATPGTGRSIGRPLIGRALVASGHVRSVGEAFERYLGAGCPAFVTRTGPHPADAIAVIRSAGGLASLAHPGLLRRDDLVSDLAAAGLAAIECFHSAHGPDDTSRYLAMAERAGLGVTGGSDFHGEESGRTEGLGEVGLPRVHFDDLLRRLESAHR